MLFNEDFLHYIWQFRLLNKLALHCTNGEALFVLHPGKANTNAGPDFSFARLRMGDCTWVGNVEIHFRSSDWLLHHHHLDPAYDTVILHAVYEDDMAIYRTDGTLIPVLVMKDLLPEDKLASFQAFQEQGYFFPCSQQIGAVDPHTIQTMLDHMFMERLEEKAFSVAEKTAFNKHHWNETFYYLLLRNFGFKVNAVPFELLADVLPSSLLIRYRDNPLQVAALLFGQAGFLENDFADPYPLQLKAEFRFLQKKHELQPLSSSVWQFLRMRPQNFPTRRLAQLVALLVGRHHFLSQLLETKTLKEVKAIFSSFEVDPYWKTHYHFDKEVKETTVQFGEKSIENLIINAVCLSLYSYGKTFKKPDLMQYAITLLKEIPAEHNSIVDKYVKNGLSVKSAYFSQAVLQLNKSYCNQKKCLNCLIGIKILNK